MGIQHYVKKPRQKSEDLTVARYEPDQPLDDLTAVAELTDYKAELVEVRFQSSVVLLVRYYNYPDNHPTHVEYETVEAGDYLAYSETYDLLFATTDANLQYYYDPA